MLLCGAAPTPVLSPRQGDVGRGCRRGLPGAHQATVSLILGVALKVLLEHSTGALLVVHGGPPPGTRGRAVLRWAPQVVIAQAAVVLVVASHV